MCAQMVKSPTAPSRSLKYCYNVASGLYGQYAHASFSPTEIASVAKLSASSGPFKCLLSDLKQYGLLEKKSNSDYSITQDFKDEQIAEGSERSILRYAFATRPDFFNRLLNDLTKLPDVEALTSLLVSRYRFNSRKAKETARALSDSLEWVGALDSKRNIIPPRADTDTFATPARSTSYNPEETLDAKACDATVANETPDSHLNLQIPLSGGRIVTVSYPADLTSQEAQKLSLVFQAVCSTPEG